MNLLTRVLLLGSALPAGAWAVDQFAPPVAVSAADGVIKVEAPGYAFPCRTDLDRDGKPDLLVGQFRDGKIKVYRGLGGDKLAAGEWLQANGKVGRVPGIW